MSIPSENVVLTTGFWVAGIIVSLVASAHVILTKRETRAAIGWIGLIWLSPVVGTLLYVLLGINRINRKARSLRRGRPRFGRHKADSCSPEQLHEILGSGDAHMADLARVVSRFSPMPLLRGNLFEPLVGGDEAYPAMLEAIQRAERSVALSSYIFNDDPLGRMFVEALGEAVKRGVEVRVLIDDIGARYDLPRVFGPLHRAGVRSAAFLPGLIPTFMPYFNLRNHRKILVVDGSLGFTGGLNIDKDYYHKLQTKHPKLDLHFRVRGPALASMFHVFADDWLFTTGEHLGGEAWSQTEEETGPIVARGLADGPDEEHGKLHNTILGALSCARTSVVIVSPYFLPDEVLSSALCLASMRGVEIDIILPSQNNLDTVQWACTANLRELLECGCRVWYTPPPFEHTKLMIVDGVWTLLGSANWDTRSLRLNFEFDFECYGRALADTLEPLVRAKRESARRVSIEEIDGRPLPVRLRDGVARLLTPYL